MSEFCQGLLCSLLFCLSDINLAFHSYVLCVLFAISGILVIVGRSSKEPKK